MKTDKENGVGEAEDDESVKVSLLLPPMNPQDDVMSLLCHYVRRNSFQENEEGGERTPTQIHSMKMQMHKLLWISWCDR